MAYLKGHTEVIAAIRSLLYKKDGTSASAAVTVCKALGPEKVDVSLLIISKRVAFLQYSSFSNLVQREY